jgi:hypothetical protein
LAAAAMPQMRDGTCKKGEPDMSDTPKVFIMTDAQRRWLESRRIRKSYTMATEFKARLQFHIQADRSSDGFACTLTLVETPESCFRHGGYLRLHDQHLGRFKRETPTQAFVAALFSAVCDHYIIGPDAMARAIERVNPNRDFGVEVSK